MKKIFPLILAILTVASAFTGGAASAAAVCDVNGDGAVNNKDVVLLFRYVSGGEADVVYDNCDINDDGYINNKDVAALLKVVSGGQTEPADEFSEGWEQTIKTANSLANGVTGKFENSSRARFGIYNKNVSIIYDLTSRGGKKIVSVSSAAGKPYITNEETYITNQSGTYYTKNSSDNGRMNSGRIGYYYYDFHIRDQKFASAAGSSSPLPLAFEHTFHTYSDKLHEEFRAVATGAYTGGGSFETRIVIPADTVNKAEFKNADGVSAEPDDFDFSSAEYAAFDIKDAGVYGIIMPRMAGAGYINVTLTDGNYVIIRGTGINDLTEGGQVRFSHRVYTSPSHRFDGIRDEAYIERNPLTDITADKTDDAVYEGYDAAAGCYRFSVKSMEFQTAYQTYPNKHFNIKTRISGDGKYDRTIYIMTAENAKTRHGRIECAAILDENNVMLPIPLEVGKNFDGENEEPVYHPEKGSGAAAYGEVFTPLTVGKNETKSYTMLHLYQNWGNYPLKQLSFITFHIPYYHLSVGVTETNCIAPYFVYGKDGWTLPDFRANSAPLWNNGTGTQHNSVGRLYFLQYRDSSNRSYKSESQSADIASSGPVYADITMDYLSDDGKIKATYRHVETAQTDENRTYYHIRLEVTDDVTINRFRENFSFFTFDSRYYKFAKVGYLDENNEPQIKDVSGGFLSSAKYYTLGDKYPYFDYFKGTNKNPIENDPNNGEFDTVNFGLIVKNSDITIGGEKYTGRFVFSDKYAYALSSPYGYMNTGSLSLDISGTVTLKKGDIMELDVILLPWGCYNNENDDNVRNVRYDSCIAPYGLTVIEGEALEDGYIPSVRAKDNEARFKISGGDGTAAVRVYGFTDYKTPTVTFKADGKDTGIKLSGVNGYDGYQVYYDGDGTYSFSFNVAMDKADEYEIFIKQ